MYPHPLLNTSAHPESLTGTHPGLGQPIPEPCLQWHSVHGLCFSVLPGSSVPSGLIRGPFKQRCLPGREANLEFCLLLCIEPSLNSQISLTRGPRQQQSPYYSLARAGKQARIPIQDLSALTPPLPSHLSGLWAGGPCPKIDPNISGPTCPQALPADTSRNLNKADW